MAGLDIAPQPVLVAQPAGQRSLPFTFAQQQGVLLIDGSEGPHLLTQGQPGWQVLSEVRRMLGEPFTTESVTAEEFQRRLTVAYQRDNNEAVQMAEDIGADVDLSRLAEEIPDSGDLMDAEDDAPIIRLINAILSQAVREQASDIHIETFEDRLSVRYRIDGVLAEVLSPKRALAPLLVSRLKVMAKLDIAENAFPRTAASRCALPDMRWISGCPPFPRPMASGWYCACWTRRRASSGLNS